MINMAKNCSHFLGFTMEANSFVFDVKVILGLESTCPAGQSAGWSASPVGKAEAKTNSSA